VRHQRAAVSDHSAGPTPHELLGQAHVTLRHGVTPVVGRQRTDATAELRVRARQHDHLDIDNSGTCSAVTIDDDGPGPTVPMPQVLSDVRPWVHLFDELTVCRHPINNAIPASAAHGDGKSPRRTFGPNSAAPPAAGRSWPRRICPSDKRLVSTSPQWRGRERDAIGFAC
jgi:hypothetical protein